jgi:hypothetical protein
MSNRKISERTKVFIGARELLSKKERWTQGTTWRDDENGLRSFCMIGALENQFLEHYERRQLFYYYTGYAARIIGGSIAAFNDDKGRRHEEVLAVLDTIIAKSIADDQKKKGEANNEGAEVFKATDDCKVSRSTQLELA